MDLHKYYKRRQQVLIISDSRGFHLWREFRRTHNEQAYFRVIARKGATLGRLWEIAESEILKGRPDIIIIFGGICDLTDRYNLHQGRREFWPPSDFRTRVNEVADTMYFMANNLKLMNVNVKLCFLPEAGCDLIRYNRVTEPVPRELLRIQEGFERGLKYLQNVARDLNRYLDMPTPWSLDCTHARRYGRLVPVYWRTTDGLHLSGEQISEMAEILSKYIAHVITLYGL